MRELQLASHQRWAACGFNDDKTFNNSDESYHKDDIESWRRQLEAQDAEEMRAITMRFHTAAITIQRYWRANRPTEKPFFLIM